MVALSVYVLRLFLGVALTTHTITAGAVGTDFFKKINFRKKFREFFAIPSQKFQSNASDSLTVLSQTFDFCRQTQLISIASRQNRRINLISWPRTKQLREILSRKQNRQMSFYILLDPESHFINNFVFIYTVSVLLSLSLLILNNARVRFCFHTILHTPQLYVRMRLCR